MTHIYTSACYEIFSKELTRDAFFSCCNTSVASLGRLRMLDGALSCLGVCMAGSGNLDSFEFPVGGDVLQVPVGTSICADYLSANSFSHVSLSMRKSLTAATNTHRFAVLTFRCFFCIQYFRCFFCIQYTRKGGGFDQFCRPMNNRNFGDFLGLSLMLCCMPCLLK